MAQKPDLNECRCVCGSLIARLGADGIELKCRRCKRLHVVAWSDVTLAPNAEARGPARSRAQERAACASGRELAWHGTED
jgi:phage FluMu protein Com